MRKNITVGLLRGGLSSERKISNASAKCVKSALISLGYKVLDIDVRDDFLTWVIKHGKQVDIFFNALHGTYGEDGKIQGVLEFTGIPYTHSGVTASAIGMDKDLSKKIFINAGVNVPRGKVLFKNEILKKDPIKRPYVIKPISEGSSLGIFIIKKTTSIEEVLKKIKKNEVLVEEYIEGNDYTVKRVTEKAVEVI